MGNFEHVSHLIGYWIGDTCLGCLPWNCIDCIDLLCCHGEGCTWSIHVLEFVALLQQHPYLKHRSLFGLIFSFPWFLLAHVINHSISHYTFYSIMNLGRYGCKLQLDWSAEGYKDKVDTKPISQIFRNETMTLQFNDKKLHHIPVLQKNKKQTIKIVRKKQVKQQDKLSQHRFMHA